MLRLALAAALIIAVPLQAQSVRDAPAPPAQPAVIKLATSQASPVPILSAQNSVIPQWITSAGGKKSFDVASVKQNISNNGDPYSNFTLGPGDVYNSNGGVFTARKLRLVVYLYFAYKVTSNQAESIKSQLPDWTLTNLYDIEARSDDHNPTKDQMRLMMQSLLADRFKLAVHIEDRQVPVLALVLAKPGQTGPQLQPHPAGDATCSTAPSKSGHTTVNSGVYPATCGGILEMQPASPGDERIGARNVSMETIASYLSILGDGITRPVLDRTGLTGKFDFNLEWAPESNRPSSSDANAPPEAQGSTVLQALKQQLGLKLEPAKGPVETIVIDHIETPSAN
jgi:uncharacterized protein (TIGR03435 family)